MPGNGSNIISYNLTKHHPLSIMKTLFCLFIISSILKAQYINFRSSPIDSDTTVLISISKDSLKFKFSVTIDVHNLNDPSDSAYSETIYNVKVYTAYNDTCIQSISDTLYYPGTIWRNAGFFDMNFDKYLDLVFVRDISIHGDEIYSVWLYDVKTKRFVNEPAYSDLCCNMYFDTNKSEIHIDYTNVNLTEMESETYKIINNKPELYFMETTRIFLKEGKCYRHIEKFKLIENNLKLMDEYVEDAFEGECGNLE